MMPFSPHLQASPPGALPADPLQQLRDITLPAPVSAWPPAPGWWVLALLLLALVAMGGVMWLRRRRARSYRLTAAKVLELAWTDFQQTGDKAMLLQQCATLLRRTALQAFPGHGVAGMHGDQWLAFLDTTSAKVNEHAFSDGEGRALLTAPYQPKPDLDPEPLYRLLHDWLLNHRQAPATQTLNGHTRGGLSYVATEAKTAANTEVSGRA